MDLIHRKEKYNEYLKKIEKAKSVDEGDYKFYEALENRSELILKDLRDQNDKLEMNLSIGLVAIPIFLLTILSFIKLGFNFMMIIPLILLFIFLVYYRVNMIGATRVVKENRIQNKDKESDRDIHWLKKKIEYITHGIEVKLTRLRAIKVYYIFFFPIFLVMLGEYLFGQIPFENLFIAFFVAFLVGGVFWHYFFNAEIDELEDTQDDLLRKAKLLD